MGDFLEELVENLIEFIQNTVGELSFGQRNQVEKEVRSSFMKALLFGEDDERSDD